MSVFIVMVMFSGYVASLAVTSIFGVALLMVKLILVEFTFNLSFVTLNFAV